MEDSGLNLFAVDPGGTTGWAVFWIPTANMILRGVDVLEDVEFECGQWDGSEDAQADAFASEISGLECPFIFEDFLLRQFRRDRDLLSPVRVMAKMEYVLWRQRADALGGVTSNSHPYPVRKQQASLAKSTVTDERLKKWNLWVTGMPHARDALRHGVTFLRRAKTDARLARWAWPDIGGPAG